MASTPRLLHAAPPPSPRIKKKTEQRQEEAWHENEIERVDAHADG